MLRLLTSFLAAMALVGIVAACLPGPLDPDGKLCDETRACGLGFVCGDDGRCVREGTVSGTGGDGDTDGSINGESDASDPTDASLPPVGDDDGGVPPNLLVNGGFELGQPPSNWRVNGAGRLATETTRVFAGQQAARAEVEFASDNQMTLQPTADVSAPQAGRVYCAKARIMGVDGGSSVRLQVRERSGNTVMGESFSPVTYPGSGAWQVLTAVHLSQGAERLEFRLFMNSPENQEWMVVDEAELWRSRDGGCVARE